MEEATEALEVVPRTRNHTTRGWGGRLNVESSYLVIWGRMQEEEATFPKATFSMECAASIKQPRDEDVKLNSKGKVFCAIKTAGLFCNSVSSTNKVVA